MLHRGVPTRTATYLTLSDMLGAQILTNKAGSFTRDKEIVPSLLGHVSSSIGFG